MSVLPATRPFTQPKQYPPVEARGRLTTGTDRWADLLTGAAVLEVVTGDETDQNAVLYWARAVMDAGRVVALDLTRFATGLHYRVSIDPGSQTWECDCPDSCYRQRRCKHVAGLQDALRHFSPAPDAAPACKSPRLSKQAEYAACDAACE